MEIQEQDTALKHTIKGDISNLDVDIVAKLRPDGIKQQRVFHFNVDTPKDGVKEFEVMRYDSYPLYKDIVKFTDVNEKGYYAQTHLYTTERAKSLPVVEAVGGRVLDDITNGLNVIDLDIYAQIDKKSNPAIWAKKFPGWVTRYFEHQRKNIGYVLVQWAEETKGMTYTIPEGDTMKAYKKALEEDQNGDLTQEEITINAVRKVWGMSQADELKFGKIVGIVEVDADKRMGSPNGIQILLGPGHYDEEDEIVVVQSEWSQSYRK